MQRFFLIGLAVFVAFGFAALIFPEATTSLIVVLLTSTVMLLIFRHHSDEKNFITNIFLAALAIRLVFGIAVHVFELRGFFGGDALTYDFRGSSLVDYWLGYVSSSDLDVQRAISPTGPGWGMNYLVGFLYLIFGRNILAAQSFCAVIGAATAPMIYFCAQKIFQNRRISRLAAIMVAFFPALIIWSGQLLKDGLIVFLLVLAMTMVIQLQEKFNYGALVLLFLSLGGIVTLRFYIFYMVAIAVAGGFLIGTTNTPQAILRRSAVIVLLGLGMTYFGVTRNATSELDRFGNMQQLQSSRMDQATTNSGFGADMDVSTPEGAISVLPIGFTYLMLAPFPWEMSNLRQAIILPEVLVWWAMIPLMIYGLLYVIRNKLRRAFPVLIFSTMLTLAYSIFQGNVGTAYRQRTQIQVFLFIFIAVGWTLFREQKENKKILRQSKRQQLERALRGRME